MYSLFMMMRAPSSCAAASCAALTGMSFNVQLPLARAALLLLRAIASELLLSPFPLVLALLAILFLFPRALLFPLHAILFLFPRALFFFPIPLAPALHAILFPLAPALLLLHTVGLPLFLWPLAPPSLVAFAPRSGNLKI